MCQQKQFPFLSLNQVQLNPMITFFMIFLFSLLTSFSILPQKPCLASQPPPLCDCCLKNFIKRTCTFRLGFFRLLFLFSDLSQHADSLQSRKKRTYQVAGQELRQKLEEKTKTKKLVGEGSGWRMERD